MRLMLAGLLLGIVHDRRLMQKAQVNVYPRADPAPRDTGVVRGTGAAAGPCSPVPKHGEVGL